MFPNRPKHPVTPGPRAGTYRCGPCGSAVEFPWKFCGYCGVMLDWQKHRRP